ncbi:prepilin peptidase dependent protein A [Bisgaardia hudsonensis]|uniref:Prepilin peptidase dependent protein A n=1 Tax=Bisgaardia hudsonensis TaxID=109472 RepID=A0A4R2N2F6_9PAST|nr:prepilin-type N-terminal cleavage/methylation domain-containing protein [Bisgaardia hudsonensis]QLB12447.1 prepilin-type N-terminal cleavage/methylation domain-containing protein [Bisgaardia hudsonensis]TCP13982.1 prepilin peptidase dependent protein A [Bisgaardia hudsonensis]
MNNKGFTLLEMLLVIGIISLLISFSLPSFQKLNDKTILSREQHKLYLFLRDIQARVENSNQIWLLIANRDVITHKWCLVAQLKSRHICNCLSPSSCDKSTHPKIYISSASSRTMLISKKYYPKELTRLSGVRNTLSTICFVLQSDRYRTVFSLFNIGSVKLKNYQSLSACVKSNL